MKTRLALPTRGVVDQVPHADRPGDTNAPGFMLNVLPHKSATGRRTLGQRPGLVPAFSSYTPLGNGPVQCVGVIGRSLSVRTGEGEPTVLFGPGASSTTATSGTVPQAVPSGKAASVVGVDGSIVQGFADATYTSAVGRVAFGRRRGDNGSDPYVGGSLSVGGWACKVVKAYGGAVGDKVISRVHVLKDSGVFAAPLAGDFTIDIEDADPGEAVAAGAEPVQAEACELVGPYLLVAAGKHLYCYDARPGIAQRYLQRIPFAGWAWHTEDVRAWATAAKVNADGTTTPARGFAFVAYRGSPTIGGVVAADNYKQGSYIRSAVAQVLLHFPASNTALAPLPPMLYGDASFLAYGLKHTDHNEGQADFRPAEYVGDSKGRAIISLDVVGPFQSQGTQTFSEQIAWTGEALIATANDGYSATQPPNGAAGYWNLLRVKWSTAGQARRPIYTREDVSSRKSNWLGTGNNNDIPYAIDGSIIDNTGVGPKSSLAAVRATALGVWLGGSFADGAKVRGRPAFTAGGVTTTPEQWTVDLGTHVGRGALDVENWPDQGVNLVAAVGTRNTAWVGATKQASAWILNARNGAVVATVDFGSGVSSRGAAFVRAGGRSFIIVTHQIT